MRLLAISDRHPPLRRSGAGSVLSELIEHLGRRHTVHTLSTDDPSFGGRLRWEAELQSSLRRLRPDVVLTLGVSVLAPGAPVVELLDGVPVRV